MPDYSELRFRVRQIVSNWCIANDVYFDMSSGVDFDDEVDILVDCITSEVMSLLARPGDFPASRQA